MDKVLKFFKPSYYKGLFHNYVNWVGECNAKGKNTHIWTFVAFVSASNYWLFSYPRLKGKFICFARGIVFVTEDREDKICFVARGDRYIRESNSF